MKQLKLVILSMLVPTTMLLGQKTGNPVEHLPSNMELIVPFGERPDISPDGKEIAFMEKSYGDVYIYNIEKRQVNCLTCGDPYASYLRVMHLYNGDYILIGSGKINLDDILIGRGPQNKLWYLSRKPGSKPVDLHQVVFEGLAVSKQCLKISYSVSHYQIPAMGEGNFELYTAEIALDSAVPRITNRVLLAKSHYPPDMLEGQDFYNNDKFITYSNYRPANGIEVADVMSMELATKKITNMSKGNCHNEAEGIFPDGQYTCVESDTASKLRGFPAGKKNGWPIDLYKLKLDGTGKNRERLTWFSDYEGYHASNPVVSNDGRFMAFSIGVNTSYGAMNGAGQGIVLLHLNK